MGRRVFSTRTLVGAVAAAATVLMTTGTALADGVTADGDTVAAGADVTLTGCTLPSSTAGQLTFNYNNSDKPKHYTPGAGPVVLRFSSTNPQVTASGSSVSVPSTYSANGDKFTAPFSTTVADATTAAGHQGSATVTVTATQGTYSNQSSYNVTWNCPVPNQAPLVSVTGVSDQAAYEFGNVPTAGCSWTDDHDGSGTTAPTLTGPTGPRAADGLGTVSVTCAKTDSGGLTTTAHASYLIQDTTPPAVPTLSDVSVAAVDAAGAHVDYSVPSATDAVDGPVALSCDHASGSLFPLGDTRVTCTATDKAGNSAHQSFQVSVIDQAAPVVTVPDAKTVSATSKDGATVGFAGEVSALDDVDGGLPVTCAPASGSTFAFGTTMVTCSATDAAGNTGTAAFAITVQDKSAPVVSVPTLDPVEATGPSGAAATWSGVHALDDIDGSLPVSCDHSPGETFPLGTTEVDCSATDSSGNTGTAAFTVVVQDTTPPSIAVPSHVTAEATSSTGALVDFQQKVSAHDLVDGDVAVSCTPASGDAFGFGDTPVTCSSTDSHGNTATDGFTVTVVDTTPPAMPKPDDLTVEALSADGAPVDYSVDDAQDLVDGPVAVTCTPASGSVFALGATDVHCSATDTHGNTGHAGFSVRVRDTTPPVIDPVSVPTTEATGPQGAHVPFTVTASDTVDPSPVVACDHSSGDWFPLGATTVACSATDASGNQATTTFEVNVADTTGPVVGSVSTVPLEATSPDGAVFNYPTPSANDLVDGSRPVACTPPSGATFPLGKTTGSCVADDLSGNQGSSSFVVEVRDTTAPAMPELPNLTAVATSSAGAVVTYSAPASHDLVDGDVATSCARASGSTFALGTTTVTCTATDRIGNVATRSFTVTVTVGWSGLQPPVEAGGSYKQGSTIPFKFSLTGASAGITGLDARIYVRSVSGSNAGTEVLGTSTSAASDGNRFRYSSSDRQYIFNLSTKGLAVGSYDVRVDLGDGVAHTVRITLR